jgi:hypothetical protein
MSPLDPVRPLAQVGPRGEVNTTPPDGASRDPAGDGALRRRPPRALPAPRDPGLVAALLLGVLLVAFALTVDFPKAAIGFQSDEATYYTLAQSLARDGDFAYERADLVRVWEEFPTGPEGIFLKRGRALELRWSSRFPFIAWDARDDPRGDRRVYFAKAFIYPLAAAPFVWLFGTNGFLLLHALLLTLDFLAAYAFLRARSEVAPALGYAFAFFFASAAPVYFVWLTPEIFNLSLGVLGLFLWAYKEVAPPLEPAANRGWARFLRGSASTWAGAALIGVATFSKPPYVALVLPMLALGLWRRQWRSTLVSGLACATVAMSLFVVNLVVTGEMNYQGGDRNTFYGGSGFPFMTADAPFRSAVGGDRGRNEVLTDILFSRDALLSVLPRNLGYFIVGRHTGLLPYYFPGVLSLLLFAAARRERTAVQWLTFAAWAGASLGLLILVPYTYSGGGGPIGNRYFMGLYPLLLFVTPVIRGVWPVVCAVGIGGLFTAQLVLNPFYASFHPAEHPKTGLYRWLPVERTLLNDLPMSVTPDRVKQPLGGVPPVWAYFLDDNAWNREGEWFWVKGQSRAELLLRGPAEPRPDGAFDSRQILRYLVEVRAGDVANRVTFETDADSQTVDVPAGGSARVAIRAGSGVPYKAHPGQPTSYVYSLSIASASGFTPLFSSGARDSRYLGAYVHLVPVYD